MAIRRPYRFNGLTLLLEASEPRTTTFPREACRQGCRRRTFCSTRPAAAQSTARLQGAPMTADTAEQPFDDYIPWTADSLSAASSNPHDKVPTPFSLPPPPWPQTYSHHDHIEAWPQKSQTALYATTDAQVHEGLKVYRRSWTKDSKHASATKDARSPQVKQSHEHAKVKPAKRRRISPEERDLSLASKVLEEGREGDDDAVAPSNPKKRERRERRRRERAAAAALAALSEMLVAEKAKENQESKGQLREMKTAVDLPSPAPSSSRIRGAKLGKMAIKAGQTSDTLASAAARRGKEGEGWQVQKEALKQKFPTGWSPLRRLSPEALDGIRAMHSQFPEKLTTAVLADQFKVSPEAMRRILKSKWRPNEDEEEARRNRWDKRGERIWTGLVAKGVHPPKKWRQMGIGGGPRYPGQKQRALQRSVRRGTKDKGNAIPWE